MTNSALDLYFLIEWRRLRGRYSDEAITRHEGRLMAALYTRRSLHRSEGDVA